MKRLILIAASVCLSAILPASANAQARFMTVNQGPDELQADQILARNIGADLIEAPEALDYGAVIENLIADERAVGTVARVTPYALVVAEMRGAKLEPIATCRSKSTRSTVISAFLVVRRSAFPNDPSGPTLSEILDDLKSRSARSDPAKFIYHDKLSTSSYFLPSLFFRAQRVFAHSDRSESADITTIKVDLHVPKSSSELVRAVATGQADLASVWDGPKTNFEKQPSQDYEQYGKNVSFVELPTKLPCDVIVATRKVDATTKQEIRKKFPSAIEDRGQRADVDTWVPWSDTDAGDAHRALSELRRQAAASTLPIVVEVRDSGRSPVGREGLDAVRLAIRLAGTELIDKSEYYDYYVKTDALWELTQIHDGAVRITVRYDNFKIGRAEVSQQFEVSYLAPADLTRRVVSLIHSRLHRIRPIWLYRDAVPTVLRDVGFDVAASLPFQVIEWNDPQRNDYTVLGEPGEASVVNSDFNFELDKAGFPKRSDGKLDFEPMGRQTFRVLLIRPTPGNVLFKVLTVAFVLLLGLAAAALGLDTWRWRTGSTRHVEGPAPDPKPPSPGPDLGGSSAEADAGRAAAGT